MISRFQPLGNGMEPVLELWIDGSSGEVDVRAAGMLDRSTARSFRRTLSDVVYEGTSEVTVDISKVDIGDVEGMRALVFVQLLARVSGSSFRWLSAPSVPSAHPHATRFDAALLRSERRESVQSS